LGHTVLSVLGKNRKRTRRKGKKRQRKQMQKKRKEGIKVKKI
jgi:hypothetical protein